MWQFGALYWWTITVVFAGTMMTLRELLVCFYATVVWCAAVIACVDAYHTNTPSSGFWGLATLAMHLVICSVVVFDNSFAKLQFNKVKRSELMRGIVLNMSCSVVLGLLAGSRFTPQPQVGELHVWRTAVKLAAFCLCSDVLGGMQHLILHRLLPSIHAVHHKIRVPCASTAFFMHPLEYALFILAHATCVITVSANDREALLFIIVKLMWRVWEHHDVKSQRPHSFHHVNDGVNLGHAYGMFDRIVGSATMTFPLP